MSSVALDDDSKNSHDHVLRVQSGLGDYTFLTESLGYQLKVWILQQPCGIEFI